MKTESELLDKIKKDPAAFAALFKLYYKPIFGYILRRTGIFEDTADISAETFSKAFTHIHQFTYTGVSIKIWLYRIATNEVNQYFRQKEKHHSLFELTNFEEHEKFQQYFNDDKKEIEAELQKHEQFNQVLLNLKKLPCKYQEVISLRYFEGKEYPEIMDILNMKEGTLKSLLSRGIKKLQELATPLDQNHY